MVTKIAERVSEKIENGELLSVSVNCGASHLMEAIVPDKIDTQDGIYIEGERLILNITNEENFTVDYDEIEDEFIINQGSNTFYLS